MKTTSGQASLAARQLLPGRIAMVIARRARRAPRIAALAAALLTLSSCPRQPVSSHNPAPRRPPAPRPAPAPPDGPVGIEGAQRIEIAAPGITGLSDLARDPEGRLWAVAERNRVVVRMEADGSAPQEIPLVGVPETVDVEGIAWIDRDRVALAAESDAPARTSDLMFVARLREGQLSVDRTLRLEYRIWPVVPIVNQGIEGLCSAGDALVGAVETVVAVGGRRLAPVVVHHLATGRWTPYFVVLTSETGKISAIACRRIGDTLDVLAVERHFEVARLIRFALPAGLGEGAPPVVETVEVADLAPLLLNRENFEGLVWDGELSFALVVDNDWTTVTGPNLLVSARLARPAPASPPVPPHR